MKRIMGNILAAAVLCVVLASSADAQPGRRYYIDAGWQFNGTVGNEFVSNASGWGAYAEGGYYILPRIAVGAFVSYNTNNEYIPRHTVVNPDGSALTTDACNSLFQVPFGATLRYRLGWKEFQPYAVCSGLYLFPECRFPRHAVGILCVSGDRLHLASVLQEQFRIPVRGVLQLFDQPERGFRPGRHQ